MATKEPELAAEADCLSTHSGSGYKTEQAAQCGSRDEDERTHLEIVITHSVVRRVGQRGRPTPVQHPFPRTHVGSELTSSATGLPNLSTSKSITLTPLELSLTSSCWTLGRAGYLVTLSDPHV